MFSHQPIFILILISYIIYITSNDNGYLKMTDEMEMPFKQYLKLHILYILNIYIINYKFILCLFKHFQKIDASMLEYN